MDTINSYDCKTTNIDTKGKKHCTTIMKNSPLQDNIAVTDGITPESPIILASVAVKIPEHCCHPCIRLDYSSSVDFSNSFNSQGSGTAATFTVTILKKYGKNIEVPIESRIYCREFMLALHDGDYYSLGIKTIDSFDFSTSDCDVLPGKSYYYVAEIVNSDLIPGGYDQLDINYPNVLVNNSALSALIIG